MMVRYILLRVVWVFIMLVAILSITFVLLKLAPEYPPTKTDEKDVWCSKQVQDGYMTSEILLDNEETRAYVETLSNSKDINKLIFIVAPYNGGFQYKIYHRLPIIQQYFRWFWNVVSDWNWGTSTQIRVNADAFGIIAERMPITFSLNFTALLVYIPIGFILGIVAALKKDKIFDNIIQVTLMIFLSVPSLVLIIVLVLFFGYYLKILPTLFPLLSSGFAKVLPGYIIPVVAMALPNIASLVRLTRAELSEVLTSDFVLLAKTKGLSHKQAIIRHSVRNSLVPLIPVIIGSFAGLLGGSYIMESVYSIPGVGSISLLAMSMGRYDYNVIMASSAFFTLMGLVVTLIVDLSYGLVDPQIRMGAKK